MEVKKLAAPRNFSAEKRKIWRELVDVLAGQMHVLTEADRHALLLLVEYLHEFYILRKYLARKNVGLTYKFTNREGQEYNRKRVEVDMAQDAYDNAVKLMARFGLTPSDRRNVRAQIESKLDRFKDKKKKSW